MSKWRGQQESAHRDLSYRALLIGIAAVVVLWYLWATIGVQFMHRQVSSGGAASAASSAGAPLPASVSELGQVGDLFGGINALFAALTVLGVFVAAYLQRTALVETRQTLAHQQFENNFFQMLSLTREITSEMTASKSELTGSRLLDSWARSVATHALKSNTGDDGPLPMLRHLASAYEAKVYMAHPSVLGPYFRSLFQTFDFIDKAPFTALGESERIRYSNIARGQISDGAVLLLAVNGMSPRGEKFAPLIEKYGLLEHMHPTYLKDFRKALGHVYQARAFLGREARAAATDVPLSPPAPETRKAIGDVMEYTRQLSGISNGLIAPEPAPTHDPGQ